MKMAKKVLSIVLAVVMALSCFAVAASAWGLESSTRHVKVKLQLGKAPNGEGVTWESATALAQKPSDITIVDGTNIYANPGDTVWVYETVTADYYVWGYSAQIYYSAALTDPFTNFKAVTGSTASLTKPQQRSVLEWNPNNPAVISYQFINCGQNAWGGVTANNRKNVDKAWPTDDQGNVVAPFGSERTPDMDNWNWERHFLCMNSGAAGALVWDSDEWLYRFPLIIPDDAAVGTVYTVTLPEGMIQRLNKKKSVFFCQETNQPDNLIATPSFKYPTDENSGEQYWDLSEATVTITVGQETAPVDLDYTALGNKINEVKASNYASAITNKAAFIAELATAEAMFNNQTATTQAEIDNEVTALANAFAALKWAADYSALDAAIALAGSKKQADYTTASWSAMQTKLTAANNVARGKDTDYQSTIDAAASALNSAIAALVPVSGANYSALDAAISLAKSKVQAHFTTASWSAMKSALDAAEAVSRSLNSEQQGVIDTATNNLNTAIGNLVEADADYTALNNAKKAASNKIAGTTSSDYTAYSWSTFQSALNAANAVATGLKAKDQSIIDNAASNLVAATNGLVLLGGADYSELDAEIATAPAYSQSYYTTNSWAAYKQALDAANAVERNLKSTQQSIVDNAKNNLVTARGSLELLDADYSAVEAAKNRVDLSDSTVLATYTTESLTAFQNACNAVVYGKKINEQAAVEAMAAAINAVVLEYKAANTKPLEDAIAYANGINAVNYTADSYAELMSKKAAGEAILAENLDIRDNARIQAAADAIMAVTLVHLGADYSALDAAKADFESRTASHYTATTWAAAKAAYDAAKAIPNGLDVTHNDEIATAAANLNAALAALVDADADYTAVDTALTRVPTKTTQVYKTLTFQIYTAGSLAAVNTAKDAVVRGLKAKDQAKVDAMAAAINAAVDGLEYADFDYSRTTDVIVNEMASKTETDYTVASWAAVQQAIANIVPGLKMDAYASAMLNYTRLDKAYNQLTLAGAADYSAVDSAISEADALDSKDYTADSWADLQAAIDAVVRGKNENFQSEVNAMAKAITDAMDALVPYVAPVVIDYSALEALYANVKDTDLTNVVVGKADFTTALAAAKTILDLKMAENQAEVDNAKTALGNAFAALKYKADYTALEKALGDANALDSAAYTADSWAVLAEAVKAGNAVKKDLSTDDQAIIDAATKAINDAIAGLKAATPEDEYGHVKNVEYTPAKSLTNKYTVKVEGRASMVQFYENATGSTVSNDRYSKKVNIVSYDKNGKVVNSYDIRNIAYEIWEIDAYIGVGDITVRAKGNGESKWEALKGETTLYTFKNQRVAPDNKLVSVVAPEEGKLGRFNVTVTVGPDAEIVQTKMANGTTVTKTITAKTETDAKGNYVVKTVAFANAEGDNAITIRAYSKTSGWVEIGTINYVASK